MNTPKITFQDRIQQSHGLIGDYPNHSSQYFGNQQNWNMAICVQPPAMDTGLQQQQKPQNNLRPDNLCSSMMSRFESPASAFYATERYMGFQQHESQVGSPSLSSQYDWPYGSGIPSQHSFKLNYSIHSGDKIDLSVTSSNVSTDNYLKSFEKPCESLHISSFGNKLHQEERKNMLDNHTAYQMSNLSAYFLRDQDHRVVILKTAVSVGFNRYGSVEPLVFSSTQEKQPSPTCSAGGVSESSSNSFSTDPVPSSKTRIRWTQDLHEKFVECVNRLGGAEKATPKAILKLMDSDGLTIFHVKSHLQKYRIARYMPDSSEGRAEQRNSVIEVPQIEGKTGLQLREALQLQVDVQKHLHEYLEIQRNLQLRIEEQGKQLRMMFDQQQKTSSDLCKNQNLDIASPDGPILSLEDFEVSTAEDSNSIHFPSKIS